MKAVVRTFVASLVLVVGAAAGFVVEEPSPAVQEITAAFEREAEAIQREAEVEFSRLQLNTIERLQAIQDRLCRDAKLDEAVAVRDSIRRVCGKPLPAVVLPLPPDAEEIGKAFDRSAADIEKRTEERVLEAGRRASKPLERIFEQLCHDAKLDEALEVRNLIRRLTGVITDVRPDPGYLHAQAADIGQVWYFEVTGAHSGSVYGTDVYTSDSSLATAAVHSNVLKVGEKGIVKVTILPGQSKYESTTRNGIASNGYGQWSVSFKVEKAFGIIRTKLSSVGATVPPPSICVAGPAVSTPPVAPAPPYCGPPKPTPPDAKPPLVVPPDRPREEPRA